MKRVAEEIDGLRYLITDEAATDGRRALRERLVEFNVQASPEFRRTFEHGRRPLDIFMRDASGRLQGGLVADCYWGWLDIDLLWVAEELRGVGHASRLIRLAEAEAVARDCFHVCVKTFGFQAPELYHKLGYQVVGTLDGFPPGSCFHWLRKDLGPQSGAMEED